MLTSSHQFLTALTIVLCVAAVTTVIFQKLRQPVVLGYILAGLLIGPHVPFPLVADSAVVQMLSELGVILLMFSLGLEFSLKKLMSVGASAAMIAMIQASIMIWLGSAAGRLMGWTSTESFFVGAIVAISSTTIVVKAFNQHGVKGKLRDLVFGVLIVQDLIAILLMAILTAVSTGAGVSPDALVATMVRLAAFLFGSITIGLLLVPRAIRMIARLNRSETTLISAMALCFGAGLLAKHAGYSVALGAFISGSLISESGEGRRVERLIEPIRDMFAAIFFVSVGMLIVPQLVAQYWVAIVVLSAVVVIGQTLSVSLGAFLAGKGVRTSIQAGLSLAQIGEFSFILAGLGVALRATGDFLYPLAVSVSVVTTVLTPWLIRSSDQVASFVDRKMPHSIQTFASLYGSWVDRLRTAPEQASAGVTFRRLVWALVVDAVALIVIVIGAELGIEQSGDDVAGWVGGSFELAIWLMAVSAMAVATPFVFGLVRVSRRLGIALAARALPEVQAGKLDLAAAPRRALVVTLQLAVVLIAGLPVVALTQAFLPGIQVALLLAILVVVLGISFWRSAANLQGHVRAGAELIVDTLVGQANRGANSQGGHDLDQVIQMLPGLGEPVAFRLREPSRAIGMTLAELNLRGLTGATVLAITRGEAGVLIPTAQEVLRANDVLALAGSQEAIAAAKQLLESVAELQVR